MGYEDETWWSRFEQPSSLRSWAEAGEPIAPEHLSERVQTVRPATSTPPTLSDAIEELKRRMIDDALRECGSKTGAAGRLGLTRQSLQQMLRRRNIAPS